MTLDVRPATRILQRALVGAFGGFLVGVLMHGYKCVVEADGLSHCYSTQEIKIGVITVAGLVTGLLVSRLRRSMTSDLRKSLLAAATTILLVVLVVAWSARNNAWWNCADLCSPYAT